MKSTNMKKQVMLSTLIVALSLSYAITWGGWWWLGFGILTVVCVVSDVRLWLRDGL